MKLKHFIDILMDYVDENDDSMDQDVMIGALDKDFMVKGIEVKELAIYDRYVSHIELWFGK